MMDFKVNSVGSSADGDGINFDFDDSEIKKKLEQLEQKLVDHSEKLEQLFERQEYAVSPAKSDKLNKTMKSSHYKSKVSFMHKNASSESSTHSIKGGVTVPPATLAELEELKKDVEELSAIKTEQRQ